MTREKEVNSFAYANLVTISLGSSHKIRDDLHIEFYPGVA